MLRLGVNKFVFFSDRLHAAFLHIPPSENRQIFGIHSRESNTLGLYGDNHWCQGMETLGFTGQEKQICPHHFESTNPVYQGQISYDMEQR